MSVYLDPIPHIYHNTEKPLMKFTSVTTILGKYHEPFDSDFFSKKIALRDGISQEEVLANWKKINDDANIYGTHVHEILERYLLAPYRIYSPRDDFEKRVIVAFQKCCTENNLNIGTSNTMHAERVMSLEFNDLEGIAGTSDIIEDIDKGRFNVWDFKGLDINTEIPTKNGFKLMGNIKVGDIIFDGDGNYTLVKHVSDIHHNPCYKITFDAGDEIICDHEHKWVVSNCLAPGQYKDVEKNTDELFEDFNNKETLLIKAVRLNINNDSLLSADPYVLGVLLGQTKKSLSLKTKKYSKISEEFLRRGYEINDERLSFDSMYQKYLPTSYLLCSTKQRLDLLRGFMDVNGHYNATYNMCIAVTKKKWLADGIADLVSSLGWIPTVTFVKNMVSGNKVKKEYHVRFVSFSDNPFLTVVSKVFTNTLPEIEAQQYRKIKRFEIIDTVPTKCLAVESETHTYLATKRFIKTHNTNKEFRFDSKYDKQLYFPINHLPDCQYTTYSMQLSIYALMYERETGKRYNRSGLFYWDKIAETFILHHSIYMKRDAENLIDHYEMTIKKLKL